jgi:hypothetical protein
MSSHIRVLHCPTSTGGNPQGLSRAEKQLGLTSWTVVFLQNYLQYTTDETLSSPSKNRLHLEIQRWKLLYRALNDFDVIHFNFGTTILSQRLLDNSQAKYPNVLKYVYQIYAKFIELRDLQLLQYFKKVLVVTFQGDDVRQGDFCRANFATTIANEVEVGFFSDESDKYKRWKILQFDKYADLLFALNPDLMHVLPKRTKFLPYSHIDLNDWQAIPFKDLSLKKLNIIHAPTHKKVKGSRFIFDAIERLKLENIDFTFTLVEGLSNAEARKLYSEADLLIDQLLAGWYGGLAVELMALGKPVICYIRDEDLKFIPEEMRLDIPIIKATPESIYEVLRYYLTQGKSELANISTLSRSYVEKWHDPQKIAEKMKREYEIILQEKKTKN